MSTAWHARHVQEFDGKEPGRPVEELVQPANLRLPTRTKLHAK